MEHVENGNKDQLTVQETILEAAEAVFSRKGYAGTRISEIAKLAKVNQALVHYYYENKEKLYQAVLALLIGKWQVHVQSTQWIGDNPRQILRQFIHTHCAYHFRYPSLYKLAKWEELEGRDLFALPFFEIDVKEKIRAFIAWQRTGHLNPAVNVNTLLYLIWAMIQHFYSKSPEDLAYLLKSEGEPSKLQHEIAEQITEIVLNGAFKLHDEKASLLAVPPNEGSIPLSVWIPPTELPEYGEAAEAIRDHLSKYQDLKVTHLTGVQQLKEPPLHIRGAVLIVPSRYGEMPDWLLELLQEWTANPALITGLCVGVWVIGVEPPSLLLQKIIEEHINRLGGYTFPRTGGQLEHEYFKRFHILVRSMA
ncbi:TetR/AcrR family transcriptional regulator [Paenibacillus piri]|uniref:TetR family transcriptional regulator n=1 Tax=Paenibacillus piri TaxID=2547395 RepID=A0A4V2ZST3_9BACL|nr:TetR/AcrR family transcriptional regulator [Paenibacillus piri]TDF94414.1 TetR family transcriptional regulator [Paenibacillus piri]